VLPLIKRGLLLAWLYIAILTARELTLSILLSTPGNMTLPVVIWSLWLEGGLGKASAAIVCFLALMLPGIVVYVALLQRQQGALRSGSLAAESVLTVGNER
jgi:iron(III) transport system permease protein